MVIDGFNGDSDVGWVAPLTSIKDFKHDPWGGVCVCVCVRVCSYEEEYHNFREGKSPRNTPI